jgi:hypothetical protein
MSNTLKPEAGRNQYSKSDNVTLDMPGDGRGNSRSYTVSRLKKHRPDLYGKVVAGEMSANAAAIKAGYRKVKTPFEQLAYWWDRADEDERRRFEEYQLGG